MSSSSSSSDQDLRCVFNDGYLVQPILLPCCAKFVSRAPMTQWLTHHASRCVFCNADLPTQYPNFNVATAVIVLPIVSMIEERQKQENCNAQGGAKGQRRCE